MLTGTTGDPGWDAVLEFARATPWLGGVAGSLVFLLHPAIRPALVAVIMRLAGAGPRANGEPRSEVAAGQASVDFWRNAIRDLIRQELDEHEHMERIVADQILKSLDRIEAALQVISLRAAELAADHRSGLAATSELQAAIRALAERIGKR